MALLSLYLSEKARCAIYTDGGEVIDGVRAGAKRLGRKEDAVKRHDEPVKLPDGTWSHEYVPIVLSALYHAN